MRVWLLLLLLVSCRRTTPTNATLVSGGEGTSSADVVPVDAVVDAVSQPLALPACAPFLAPLSARGTAARTVDPATDRTPAVVAACARLEGGTQTQLANGRRRMGWRGGGETNEDPLRFGPVGRCLSAGRGAWFVELTAVQVRRERCYTDRQRWCHRADANWSLVYVSQDGTLLRAPALRGQLFLSDPSDVRIEVPLRYDFDGDGVAELWLRVRTTNFEGGDALSEAYAVTVHAGNVEPYAPARGLEFASAEDVDGDGRPDFAIDGPQEATNACGTDGVREYRGPSLLAHSLPGGTFSREDAVGRAHVVEQCLEVPLGGGFDASPSEPVLAVGCERFRGTSAEEVERLLRAQGEDAAWCPDLDALVSAARQEVPFVIPRCNPR